MIHLHTKYEICQIKLQYRVYKLGVTNAHTYTHTHTIMNAMVKIIIETKNERNRLARIGVRGGGAGY